MDSLKFQLPKKDHSAATLQERQSFPMKSIRVKQDIKATNQEFITYSGEKPHKTVDGKKTTRTIRNREKLKDKTSLKSRNKFIIIRNILSKLIRQESSCSTNDISKIVSIIWKKRGDLLQNYSDYLSDLENAWHSAVQGISTNSDNFSLIPKSENIVMHQKLSSLLNSSGLTSDTSQILKGSHSQIFKTHKFSLRPDSYHNSIKKPSLQTRKLSKENSLSIERSITQFSSKLTFLPSGIPTEDIFIASIAAEAERSGNGTVLHFSNSLSKSFSKKGSALRTQNDWEKKLDPIFFSPGY